jgi:hypothetical protein
MSALETLKHKKPSLEKTLERHGVGFKRAPMLRRLPDHPAEEHKAQSAQALSASLDVLDRSLAAR